MASFTAKSRVPTRPLSYANKAMAYRKELLVDYTNGMIYIIDENNNEHNVSEQVYTQLIEKGDITNKIEVVIPDGSGGTTNVTIEEGFTQVVNSIDSIQNNITKINEIIDQLKGESGTLEIKASDIVTDAAHQFLTQTQVDNIQKKVTINEVVVTINPSEIIGTEAPYSCVKTVAGLNPTYPAPTIDIKYTDDVYENNNKEEDAYYCIHRCKILNANEATFEFKQKPETAFHVLFQIKTPGI